eukprot:8143306-Pyramimonas_sp.AAC.1
MGAAIKMSLASSRTPSFALGIFGSVELLRRWAQDQEEPWLGSSSWSCPCRWIDEPARREQRRERQVQDMGHVFPTQAAVEGAPVPDRTDTCCCSRASSWSSRTVSKLQAMLHVQA